MEGFGVFAFLVLIFVIGRLVGQSVGSIRALESVKESCDRYGSTYIKDVRYSCKPELAAHPTKDTKQ